MARHSNTLSLHLNINVLGFDSFNAIQRTIREMVSAVLANELDRKIAGRIMAKIQIAIRLQKLIGQVSEETY